MIVGAGLAGLIAAHIFPREPIMEAAQAPRQMHRAVLRFRSTVVADLLGIEFRKVRVRKGIFVDGNFCQPDIFLANRYSRKCMGQLNAERSIWNIDPVDRYIAPETLYEQLVEVLAPRIHWGHKADYAAATELVISTAPLPVTLRELDIPVKAEFARAPITVARFRVPKCDVHQTVYFPTDEHSLYRASITGDLLICEFAGFGTEHAAALEDVLWAFGLDEIDPIDKVGQEYGKIAPVDERLRKHLVHRLTTDHNIYSLGRFATWRNLLLDDVVQDAAVIKRLIHATPYERRIAAI